MTDTRTEIMNEVIEALADSMTEVYYEVNGTIMTYSEYIDWKERRYYGED